MRKGIVKTLGNWLTLLVLATMIIVPAPVRVLAAGNTNLALLPASQTVSVNNTFDVVVQVRANGEQINVAQFYLDFDPAYLYVNSITPAATWYGNQVSLPENTVDNDNGRVNFAGGILGVAVNGSITIATINFLARAATAKTNLAFHFAPGTPRDTDVYGITSLNAGSVLGSVSEATVTISGAGTPASQLVSIAVNPPNPSITAGLTQQFTATGTYSDKSSSDITYAVTWASSNKAIAGVGTISNADPGLSKGLAAGTTTVTATLGALSATAVLTVTKTDGKPVTSPPGQTPVAPASPSTPPPPGTAPGTISPAGEPKTTAAPPAAQGVPAESPAKPGPAPAATVNWLLIGSAAVSAVIIGLVLYLLLRMRPGD